MKKLIFILLGVTLSVSVACLLAFAVYSQLSGALLAGASEPSQSAETAVPTDPAATAATSGGETLPVSRLPIETISLAMPIVTEQDLADDGEVVFTATFQDVILSLPDSQLAAAVTLDLLQQLDGDAAKAAALQAQAYQDYEGQEGWEAYTHSILLSAQRLDTIVLSLYGTESFADAVEAQSSYISVSYDLLYGTRLTLSDVLSEESTAADALEAAILSCLAEQAESLYEDYAATVQEGFPSLLSADSGWYFTVQGLAVYYEPYTLAPGGLGVVVAEVPYSSLTGILLDAYFPAELDWTSGSISVSDAAQAEITAEVPCEPAAQAVYLTAEGAVYNLSLTQGHRIGSRFVSDAVVFQANILQYGDCICLYAQLSESGELLLCYQNVDGWQEYYLAAGDSGPILQ